jgi:hypothetical protein
MEITVTLKEGAVTLYPPEVNTNLPAGVAVKYGVKLASAIKDAVIDATKAKEIKTALLKAKWKFDGEIGDAMKSPPPDGVVGAHKLKFKIGSTNLAKQVRCHIAGVKAQEGSDVGGGAGTAKDVKKATDELARLAKRFPDDVGIKVGDSHHPKNVIYSLTMGRDKVTASIPHPEDTHIKPGSRKAALTDWKKNMAAFIKFQKENAKEKAKG